MAGEKVRENDSEKYSEEAKRQTGGRGRGGGRDKSLREPPPERQLQSDMDTWKERMNGNSRDGEGARKRTSRRERQRGQSKEADNDVRGCSFLSLSSLLFSSLSPSLSRCPSPLLYALFMSLNPTLRLSRASLSLEPKSNAEDVCSTRPMAYQSASFVSVLVSRSLLLSCSLSPGVSKGTHTVLSLEMSTRRHACLSVVSCFFFHTCTGAARESDPHVRPTLPARVPVVRLRFSLCPLSACGSRPVQLRHREESIPILVVSCEASVVVGLP